MVTLFFGNLRSVLSTVLLIAALFYIVLIATKHKGIEKWGRKALILAILGLLLCIFVALRDDYVVAVQGGQDYSLYNRYRLISPIWEELL